MIVQIATIGEELVASGNGKNYPGLVKFLLDAGLTVEQGDTFEIRSDAFIRTPNPGGQDKGGRS